MDTMVTQTEKEGSLEIVEQVVDTVVTETERGRPFEIVKQVVDTTLTKGGERVVDTILTGTDKPMHEIVMLDMLSLTLEKRKENISRSWRRCEAEIDRATDTTKNCGWITSYNKKWFLELTTLVDINK